MKILKFYADWCGPCKQLSETLSGMDLNVLVEPVNIDTTMVTAIKYNVRSVPTMVLVDDEGNDLARLIGNQPESKITEMMGRVQCQTN